jgi:hypothetical protein
MYSWYETPKKRIHSLSSAFAVAIRKRVAVIDRPTLIQEMDLKNIPHVSNNREQ